ncbi:MAG: ATP-binding protein [Pyrinomonadaceae bacterium]
MSESNPNQALRRVLGRVERSDFVGRTAELQRIVAQAKQTDAGRGMLLLLAPSAGVSELLRQAYDELFTDGSSVVPIYFAFTRSEITAVSAAIEFLISFLQQYVAYRRSDPSLCRATLTLNDVLELAPAADLDWIQQVVDGYTRQRFSNDDKALIRFCLGAPQRVPARRGRPFVMLDGVQLAEQLNGAVVLATEVLRVFTTGNSSFLLAGLRRQMLAAAHNAQCDFENLDMLRLEQLSSSEGRLLVEHVARRQQVETTAEVRDLLVQQFAGSPFFITKFLQAARDKRMTLTSYLDCERLYVDELLGGHLHHHFHELLDEVSPDSETRVALIRLLRESTAGDESQSPVEVWRRRLRLTQESLEEILYRLHVQEFINWDGATLEVSDGPQSWNDYLKLRYRLDVLNEPRALVVADALAEALKRAPRTMARHYRQSAKPALRELLSRFDCQRVPSILFDSSAFTKRFVGTSIEETNDALQEETSLSKLPQIVHVASCVAFSSDLRQVCEEEHCVVGHGFENAIYSDAEEIVWLVADIDSKLAVEADVTTLWLDRLDALAGSSGFRRHQVWLISNEGFSADSARLLRERGAFGSSRQQLALLGERMGNVKVPNDLPVAEEADEFLVVMPMGEDNELIAASTVEQVARRLSFRPEAINQIKTAIVEACINASEHSFSPDQKIYQRLRVENDKLVVTISSRGIVPPNTGTNNKGSSSVISEADKTREERRGWGLKLIRTLMDEVEFERVDEGTSLRMTKYLRDSQS